MDVTRREGAYARETTSTGRIQARGQTPVAHYTKGSQSL
jgi:hypothetical protein